MHSPVAVLIHMQPWAKPVAVCFCLENPTGATRLYKKAGIQVAAEYVIYEKELRSGREPEEQE